MTTVAELWAASPIQRRKVTNAEMGARGLLPESD